MKKVKLYTDGSSRGNPGPGGYGVILEDIKSGVIRELSLIHISEPTSPY